MKKKLLSFFALAVIGVLAYASTQALRRAGETVLWESEGAVTCNWAGEIQIAADKLADVKVGDKIHVAVEGVTPAGEWDAQVALYDGNWTGIEQSVAVGLGNKDDVAFVVTGDIKRLIQANGLMITGTGFSSKKVTLEPADEALGSDNSIWVGSHNVQLPLNINHFKNANGKTGVKAGDILRVTCTATDPQWFVLSDGEWTDVEGATFTDFEGGKEYIFTAETAEIAKTKSLIINQNGYTITQVELLPTYAVTIGEGITGGTVSVDKATAAEGDEVTITATPNEGYKVKSYSVTGVNTNLAVTVNNGKFKMPADDVTVSVTFNQSVDVTIAPASGDISEAIKAELGNNDAKNVTINLAENGAYTLSGTIKAGGSVTINGNGSTIDASTGDNIVGIDGVAGFAKKADETDSDHSLVNAITFKDVTITGMQKALVRDLMTKTLLETLTIDNCVMQVSNAKPFIDFDSRGYVGKVVVKNSTLWASAPTDKNFAKYGSRPKNVNEALNQEFDIQNSTIVNIGAKADFSGGQNFNNLKQNGTANNIYTLKNNIFVNCGKSGQVVVGFNNGQTSATPVWDVDKNAFNWNGADVAAAEVTKAGQKSEADIVKNCVAGVVVFADAANGDFTLGDCAQYTAKTGDPRWISAKTPKDVTIAATDITDGDITAAVSAAEGALAYNETVGNITITLDKTVAYKVTAPIVACGNITINGNGAEIDASALDGNFTQMAAVENPTEWTAADVTIKGITVKGLKKALFYSACKKYIAENFIIDDCVVELAGDATTIDYTKGSTAKNITVTNSTFYAPTATTKSFYSSQSGQKTTEYNAEAIQTFKFEKNTMYNLAKGKNFFSHRQSNQKWMTYDVKNNIFVDCGKSGQVIKGMNGGSSGTNPVWDIDGNVFNFDGADTSADETTGDEAEPVKNSIAGRVLFKDAAKGDFGGQFVLAPTTTSMPEAIGDPRWTLMSAASFAINIALGIENGTVTTTPAGYAAKDEVVTIKGTPASGFVVESYLVKKGEENVSVGADATFKMPEAEVLVSAVFSKAPVDIAIAAADITGGDITAAIAAKKAALAEGETVGNITITLAEGTYTVSSPIEAPASLTINGAAGAVIDASALEAALITTPAGDLALWKEASLTVKDVTIKGVKKGVYASAGKNYLYNDFQIDNCVIEIAATSGFEFDFRKGGVAKNFTINKSTIYAPEATTNSLYTSQSAQKGTEAPGVTVQTFAITNSTLYNLAKGKNFFTHRQSNQKWLAYTIKNSVFLNVGKSGQVVKGINQGQNGANPTWDIDGNIFNFEGKDTSADETTGDEAEPVKNSIAGIVTFTDAAAGTFDGTFATTSDITSVTAGDPRWKITVEKLDVTTLDATIAKAEGLLEGKDATVADSPEKTLSDAIATAKAAKAAAKSQTEVDAANTALETAIETYKTATGINGITVDGVSGDIFSDGKPVYNLSGQRVFKGYKGIVIKNGRKVVIK